MKTLCMIANSHIDPVWLWDKYEGIDEVINTFRSACDRLDENPDLRFTASSVMFYKWTKELAPDVFARIKKHVAEGRWEAVGRWLVEHDVNLPLLESFDNSIRISTEFTRREFGETSPVAYSPDTFGHPATLPEILWDRGFRYYVFCRPGIHEKTLPSNLFWWESGGKRILCLRLKYHYCQGRNPDVSRIREVMNDHDIYFGDAGCYFFGVGDHGGGPSKEEIAAYMKLKEESKDVRIRFATCLEFFREAEKAPDIPTVTGDLHMHAIGCYSVNRMLKEGVRNSERALSYTGRMLEAAGMKRDLSPLWETVVFNEFHDILPGSCSPAAARQAAMELSRVRSEAMDTAYTAAKKLSRQIPVRCREGEFRIFNSLPFPVKGPFEVESFMYYREGAPFVRQDGSEVPVQLITPSVYCANRRWLFTDEIPARSMACYAFDSSRRTERSEDFRFSEGDGVSLGSMEARGLNIYKDGQPLFAAPLSLTVYKDESDTWSHGIDGYHYGTDGGFALKSVTRREGRLASFVLCRLAYGTSEAEVLFTLYRDLPYADVGIHVNWNEKQK
ncbi:MAG: alpha-mannosidase, partial [Abditibacteriota bacterium]|nr:alpha-mannosidase [Abditibacteriota bacterium]